MRSIDLFEVPRADDAAFLADWDSERVAGGVLYRALREDVEFRFVAVARVDEGSPAPELYEVVHEEGEPDGSEGVTLINPFDVPESDDERFVAGWERARAALADQRGYLGTRLHRSAAAGFRFVNLARWSSPLMFARATQRPEFRAAGAAIPFAAHPALYSVVRD
jgi:heme-degrading monooxygenase HmoA